MAINTIYLDGGAIKSARNVYMSQNPKNIRLANFFQKSVFGLLEDKLDKSKYSLKFDPYKYKYFATKLKEIDTFINGNYFKNLVEGILRIKKYKVEYTVRKFTAENYTLLHDEDQEEPGVDFFIDFSDCTKNFGGYTAYLNEKDALLFCVPSKNTASFIERGPGVMKFTKYVDHRQKNPIIQVAGTVFSK